MNGAKTSFAIQKAQHQAKIVKPGTLTMNHTWNPNVPRGKLVTRGNTDEYVVDEDPEMTLRLKNEEMFDAMMENILNIPLHQALEPSLKKLFNAEKCVLWVDKPSEKLLYSPSFDITAEYNNAVVGFVRNTRSVIQILNQAQCPTGFVSHPKVADPDSPQLIFPLTAAGIVRGVIQLVRKPKSTSFSLDDISSVAFMMRKFALYGESLFNYEPFCNVAIGFFQKSKDTPNPLTELEKYFQCRVSELWKYDAISGRAQIFDRQRNEMVNIQAVELGIVGYALSECKVVNERMASSHPQYCVPFDGVADGPILVVPYKRNRREIWAAALRGRSRSFNVYDEMQVSALLPFIISSTSSGSSSADLPQLLTHLLDIASIFTSTLKTSELIESIKEHSTQLLECERSSIVILHKKSNQLRMDDKVFQLGVGIAGHAIAEKKTYNVTNPKNNSLYDPQIDSDGTCDPSMILAIPIYSLVGDPIGVLSLYNKLNGEPFNDMDVKITTVLNAFAGIAFENSKLYNMSYKLSQAFFRFIETAKLSDETVPVKTVLAGIMQKALKVTHSERLTFFIRDGTDSFYKYLNVGSENDYGPLFAMETCENQMPLLLDSEGINSRIRECHYDFARHVDSTSQSASQSFVQNMISSIVKDAPLQISEEKMKDETIYCIPMQNEEGTVLGAMEFSFLGFRSQDDLFFLRSFTNLSASIFPKLQLKELATYGYGDLDIKEWVTNEERIARKIPELFKLDDTSTSVIFRHQFDVNDFDGIGLFKVVFKIFSKYNLMESFEFSNSQLFFFLREMRLAYQHVPYHNWRHAIDTLQFCAFQVTAARLDRVFSKFELFALFVAAICHDAKHDELERLIEAGAETPLSYLMKQQSVVETEHCIAAVSILTRDECNIFTGLNPNQYKAMWNLVFDLILATDMSRHFNLLSILATLFSSGEFDHEENTEHKILLMKLVIKAADLSGLARPFDIACLHFPYIAEEFFRQGELEIAEGIFYVDGIEDREHIDKYSSLLGFATNICLPLFESVSKSLPQLSLATDQVKNNIMRWKKQGFPKYPK